MHEIRPRGRDLGDSKLPSPDFPEETNGYPGIRLKRVRKWVPGYPGWLRQHFYDEKVFLETRYEIRPRGHGLGMISCHPRNFESEETGTRVPEAQILVTGISKPGNPREYPGNWQKGNTSRYHTAVYVIVYLYLYINESCWRLPTTAQ